MYSTEAPPLPKGDYYLVDISSALELYRSAPQEVRAAGVRGFADYTVDDLMDIEVSAILPCLEVKATVPGCLDEHIESILGEAHDEIEAALIAAGQPVPIEDEDGNGGIEIPKINKQHSELIYDMAFQIHDILVEHGMYVNGKLLGEHCTLKDEGLLVLVKPR